MATAGQLAKRTSDALQRIQAASHKLAAEAGTPPPSVPLRSRYGTEVLQAEQLTIIADWIEEVADTLAQRKTDPWAVMSRAQLLDALKDAGADAGTISGTGKGGYVTADDLRNALRQAAEVV